MANEEIPVISCYRIDQQMYFLDSYFMQLPQSDKIFTRPLPTKSESNTPNVNALCR